MNVIIIKYNSGNVLSVAFALERIGIKAIITDDKEKILSADKIILPGVGEASTAMNYLTEHKLDELVKGLKQPVLGICLGMQLFCRSSEEGNTKCLGIFDQEVKIFPSKELKVPQVGWNRIFDLKTTLFKNIKDADYQYFVHSYYVEQGENTIATTTYGISYSAALRKNNFYAVQFHPEKSGTVGQTILENFLKL